MPTDTADTTAFSAPGKVLLAGGYLVLDRAHTGLVFGLSARINVVAQTIETSPGVQLSEIVVESPQFREAQWSYGYHLADDDGGMAVTQLRVGAAIKPNRFVETTLSYALTYVSRLNPPHSFKAARLTILADNAYYSQPAGDASAAAAAAVAAGPDRFARFPTTIADTHKTGLGSSAALVTAMTATVLGHYLPTSLFDLSTDAGKRTLHNLAQAAHCAAQGKVGSGFDVAAAVYGSCTYRRFSPAVLAGLPEPGQPGFGAALERVVAAVPDSGGSSSSSSSTSTSATWDQEITPVALPPGVSVRMCDVDLGSETVGMVKTMLAWRARDPARSAQLWAALQARDDALAAALKDGRVADLPGCVAAVRALVREMSEASGVPVEPPAQTELLDAVSAVDGVYGGVVPGAGGFDAVALLVRDDAEAALEAFLTTRTRNGPGVVRMLGVKSEMEGARREDKALYDGWLH